MKPSEKAPAAALKKFARHLLTTTCLTAAAAGVASAGTINESSVPGADFGNTFGVANVLPVGTDGVIGGVNTSDNDFFRFSGLLGGGAYTLTGVYTGFATYSILNSSQGVLNPGQSNPASFSGTIPGDGILVVSVQQNEQLGTYDLTLAAPQAPGGVPEPATLTGVGLGLAGAWALRRKRAKK